MQIAAARSNLGEACSNQDKRYRAQKLPRRTSSKITMDTYSQTEIQVKRKAQLRIATELRKPQSETESEMEGPEQARLNANWSQRRHRFC
jgi:hypothetical protein